MIENSIVQSPVNSFDVGKNKNQLLCKNSDPEPQSHTAYSIVYHLFFSYGDLAGTFNVLTYTSATSHVANMFLLTSKSRYRVMVYTQPDNGVDGTPHPIICFR